MDPGPSEAPPLRTGGALAFPLPAGLRDLMPGEARRQAELSRAVLDCFERHGYELVSCPLFEYAGVLEHEVGAQDAAKVVRFVEPETGEVLAFRPDITPQIARVVATRLVDTPMPARLCYEGAVVRRRQERARRGRQLQQAGIELIGLSGPEGDLETLRIACEAVRSVGLDDFTLDIGHAMVAADLLEGAAPEARSGIFEALSVKDPDGVRRLAEQAGITGRQLDALIELPGLWGGLDVLDRAERLLRGTPAAAHAAELSGLVRAADAAGLAPRLVVDLGEIWSFSYYTGFMMRLLAHGPGESVASGGRYDQLYDRFGVQRPAAGAAIDLGNLGWALEHAGRQRVAPQRVLIASNVGAREPVQEALRTRGIDCAWLPEGDAVGYAKAWRFGHVLSEADGRASLLSVADGRSEVLQGSGAEALADQVVSCLANNRASQGE